MARVCTSHRDACFHAFRPRIEAGLSSDTALRVLEGDEAEVFTTLFRSQDEVVAGDISVGANEVTGRGVVRGLVDADEAGIVVAGQLEATLGIGAHHV